MKKMTRNTNLAVLLLSTLVFTTCTPPISVSALESSAPATSSLHGPQDSKEVEAFADQILADKMKKFNVNGSNFVVVKDGKVVVNKGYGYADKEKKTPVDKNTVFQIASVSKTFTALAAMQLVEQGKMNLNHDIQEYLGGLKVPNQTGKPLTLNHLLTYTSGVDLPDITTYVSPEFIDKDIPMKEFLVDHMPTVVRTPGEAYTYDNFGYLLAGYAVENVSGIPFAQYMDKKIFKPLGMNSTSARFTPELLARMATHYKPTGEAHETYGHAPTDGPQGSIISTGDDMSKYMIMQLQKGTFENKQIISKKSMDQMHTYQVFAEKSIPMTTVGGFEGYFNNLMNGQHVVLKGGSMPGHQSLMVLLPEKNVGLFMSYNNDTMMSLEVYEAFMDHYYPQKTPKSTYVPLNEKDAKKYLGIYQNTRLFFLKSKFSYANGNLLMETGTNGKHTLKMINPLLFEDEAGNKLAFKKNHKGNIEYFYYSNPESLDFVSDAQKMHMKQPFSDVPANSKYKSYIDNLHAFGIMGAKSGNTFDPQGTMTQAEFANTLFRAHGWYGVASVIDENKQKMIEGIPNFDANAPITRQTAAVMIQNLKQVKPAAKITLTGQTDTWAVDAIRALISTGIVDPDTKVNQDGSVDFRSKQPLLRQEASALLDKAFGYYSSL
ncbi:serine hydrolase [Brevibacterium sp. JNUCC-42]|nr:serine hydrolase [Brevibacterium sp. JNUCC-42]